MHGEAGHESGDAEFKCNPDQEHGDATEAREEAGARAEVAKGGADLGGNGLGADEKQFLLDVLDFGVFLVQAHERGIRLIGVRGW